MCDGNGEGCYRMRFSRMDGGRVRWPQKCLDVRAPLKRGIYRVAVTSSWSSGLEIDHGASSYTFRGRTWEVEWEAWESLSPWARILLSYNRALSALQLLGQGCSCFFPAYLFFLLVSSVVCKEDFLCYGTYILPHTNNIHHFNIFKQ